MLSAQSFLSPRTFPGTTWPRLALPAAARIWAAYLELDRSQWLDPGEIQNGQLRQVRSLLAHCMKNVPYYREVLTAHGIEAEGVRTTEDLRRIPILSRRTYQEEFARMQAEHLPEGTRRTGKVHTSGTTGVPIEVLQTNVVRLWWWAFFLRDLEWCRIDPRGTLAVIRLTPRAEPMRQRLLDGVSLPHWDAGLDAVLETGKCHVMDINQDPRRQLEWLCRLEPDYLLSFASNLEFLARLAQEQGRRIATLRAIQSIAETLSEDMKARIESAFGVPVKDTYSCYEAGYVASPCPAGYGWHVHAENVLLEILDDEDRPCPPGRSGRVVLTALHNFLTPFIRYEIMDEAEPGPERCPCGRGLPTLARVCGKRLLMLRLPNGRLRSSSELKDRLKQLGGFHQVQVVLRAVDHVLVRIVPASTWTHEHAQPIVELVQEHLEAPVHVEVLAVDRVHPSPGGKILDFVSELEPEVMASP